jgi:hypothetical protein
MKKTGEDREGVLCFVTVLDAGDLGFLGGLLMLNPLGRPLEFHCTAPVKPSRAHEILYGNTLRPHLFGERFSQALLDKSALHPDLILTDLADVMTLQPQPGSLLVQLISGEAEFREAVGSPSVSLERFGDWQLAGESLEVVDRAKELLLGCTGIIPWEPFERIREALGEAAKTARPASTAVRTSEAA